MSSEITNQTKVEKKLVEIYALGEKCCTGRHVICCVPAATPQGKEVKDWYDVENKPLRISVEFMNGVAKVDPQLADFLTDPERNIASKKRPNYTAQIVY